MNRMNRATVSGGAYGFITDCKSVIIAIVAFVLSLYMIVDSAHAQMFNDYPEVTSKPEFRHEASGAFIRLKCSLNPCHTTNIFRWEYKACGSDLHTTECHNSEDIEWMPVPANIKSKKCGSIHLINNATGRYSGLYRCSKVSPESNDDVRVVKIFELRVIDRYPFKNGTNPIILAVQPGNITTIPNSKITMQCKVHSTIPPEIWWLRQIDITASNVGFLIPTNNKRYVYLKASYKSYSRDTYISKLVIEKPTAKHTGIYTCFAVNMFGSSDQDVLVTVTPSSTEWQARTSYLALFLILFCVAPIPITVWLCICYYQKDPANCKLSTPTFVNLPVLRLSSSAAISANGGPLKLNLSTGQYEYLHLPGTRQHLTKQVVHRKSSVVDPFC